LAKLAGDGKIATGTSSGAVGKYAKAAAGEARRLAGGRAEIRDAESVRPHYIGGARRGGARNRLCDRRQGEPGVKIVGTFPADSHPPIIYPVAATATRRPDRRLSLLLRSSAAKTILENMASRS